MSLTEVMKQKILENNVLESFIWIPEMMKLPNCVINIIVKINVKLKI